MLYFNVAFFVVLLSTVVQGTTIEPVARLLRVTSDEAAIPVPLVEPVLLSRLGAEVVQFPVRASYAVVGHPVRELGLPREALLNVIVRGDRAIPPRGSTIVQAGDQLHLIVRQEVAVEFQHLLVAVADRPAGGSQAPAPARAQPAGGDVGAPVGPRRRRPVAPVGGRGHRGRRPAAHAARRAGRARRARRRPLRGHRPAAGGRPGRRAAGGRAAAARARRVAGRPRLVAGDRRRA